MPYIKLDARLRLERGDQTAVSAGELNYVLTTAIANYLDCHGLCYATLNDILGALEGAKLEFYRRVVAPYEDTKIKENGDVY